MTKPQVVYVDVDDTLIRSAGSKRIPIPGVVREVRRLHGEGAYLICWSSVGEQYAEEVATELGIESCFRAFLPKPVVMIDDQEPSDWRYLKILHPNEV